MAVSNIIELRQLLREKFPGLRTRVDELSGPSRPCWPTGLARLDRRLGGGFAKSALSEVVPPSRASGGASLARHLIQRAAQEQQFAALVDSHDSFDPAGASPAFLQRLLWLRCRHTDEALKAADLVLRDGNLPLVLLDLALAPAAELRKVPAPTWYRFQRIVEERGVTCIVFTPRPMVAPAQMRVTWPAALTLDDLSRDADDLVESLDIEVSDMRRGVAEPSLRRTA
jgi:hypothetical protein